ncbi:MAG: MOSC domain-containing protein, partial [Flammeovirgaceae bacterium]
IETGIYKYPTTEALVLGREDVEGDQVVDRRYHGGIDQACYCYAADHYAVWKAKYPNLSWNWGMFGENLTVEGMDEASVFVGDVYQLGSAQVQVTKPRQPCFKLGIRFGTQQIVKDFVEAPYPGVYLKVLEVGKVSVGDEFQLLSRIENSVSILEVYELLFRKEADAEVVERALNSTLISGSSRATIQRKWGNLLDT